MEFYWSPSTRETPYLTFLSSLYLGTNPGITFKVILKKGGYLNTELLAAEDSDFFENNPKY